MRFDPAVFLENTVPAWLQRLIRRRCNDPFPGPTQRRLLCQEWRGHEGDHRFGTVITWPQRSPSRGHMHVVPENGRRR